MRASRGILPEDIRRFQVHFSDDNKLLRCQAAKVDEVDGIAACISADLPNVDLTITQPSKNSPNHSLYATDELLQSAIQRVLIFDPQEPPKSPFAIFNRPWTDASRNVSWSPPAFFPDSSQLKRLEISEWGSVVQSETFTALLGFRHYNATFHFWGRSMRSLFPPTIPPRQEPLQSLSPSINSAIDHTEVVNHTVMGGFFRVSLSSPFLTRRLFTTKAGLVGAAPPNTWQGDSIYMIPGCSMPVALRRKEECFEIVGACYVDLLMREYDIEWHGSGEYVDELEEITLC